MHDPRAPTRARRLHWPAGKELREAARSRGIDTRKDDSIKLHFAMLPQLYSSASKRSAVGRANYMGLFIGRMIEGDSDGVPQLREPLHLDCGKFSITPIPRTGSANRRPTMRTVRKPAQAQPWLHTTNPRSKQQEQAPFFAWPAPARQLPAPEE